MITNKLYTKEHSNERYCEKQYCHIRTSKVFSRIAEDRWCYQCYQSFIKKINLCTMNNDKQKLKINEKCGVIFNITSILIVHSIIKKLFM